MDIRQLITVSKLPHDSYSEFNTIRLSAFKIALDIFNSRVVGYNQDHVCYEEQVYGVVSLASEIYKRASRLASLLSPTREEELDPKDINRMCDVCIDMMNYLSWTYALLVLTSGSVGNVDSDDAPKYTTGEPK